MKIRKYTFRILAILAIMVLGAGSAMAQGPEYGLAIEVDHTVSCGEGAADVEFTVSWSPVEVDKYRVFIDFGDGDTTEEVVTGSTLVIMHSYTDHGDYELVIKVTEIIDLMGLEASGVSDQIMEVLTLEGPEVTLFSEPSPPVFVVGEEGLVNFSAVASEGTLPYTYEWDLGGGTTSKTFSSDTASASYTEEGKYEVQATVRDKCGFTASASMPVVVASPEEACHPMAQRIADAVNTLFPDQAGQEYTCEDIYTLFDNPEGDNNLGFGRMWMAYRLAESVDLDWEEILAWKMDQSSWGSLLQLNRFAEAIGDQGIGDLMALVMSKDYTLSDVRTAIRSVSRYEADFNDALTRIADGASSGELSQFYRLASELEVAYGVLDGYLADGMTISELNHTYNFASRLEVDWTEIADFRSLYGDNWGDLKQAFALATDEVSADEILAMGVQEFRKDQKADEQAEGIAEKLANQYSYNTEFVLNLFNAECEGSWACVRKALRDQSQLMSEGVSEKDQKTALQIASKYNSTEGAVLAIYQDTCDMDWGCTRTYFRNLDNNKTGKPD